MSDPMPHEVCPCCQQRWVPGRSKMDAKRLIYGLTIQPQALRLVEHLVEHFGECVSTERLVSVLYHDATDGGPISAANVVAARLVAVRKKLAPYGLEIEGKSWRGNRIKWVSSEPTRQPI